MKTNTEATSNDDLELEQAYKRAAESLGKSSGCLFALLWKNRGKLTKGKEIWIKALQHNDLPYENALDKPLPQAKKYSNAVQAALERKNYQIPAANVRERCNVLKKQLEDYFSSKASGWVISLPAGGPKRGYQLEWHKRRDPQSLTRAFWKAHLDSPGDTRIVLVEQLFFRDRAGKFVFRYYDCNSERSRDAIDELKKAHPQPHFPLEKDADPKSESAYPYVAWGNTEDANARFKPAYPYIAWGDIGARDLITNWFAENENIKVETAVTRRLERHAPAWEDSLILFGGGSANTFVESVLKKYPDLPIRMQEGNERSQGHARQVFVASPTDEELENMTPYSPIETKGGYIVQYDTTQEMVLAILSRLPNPHAPENAVTLFNSDFGRAIEQIALLVTDEARLRRARKMFLHSPLEPYFQALCAVPTSQDHNLPHLVEVLAIRPYQPKGA